MKIVISETENNQLAIKIPYHEKLLFAVRGLPGREWDRAKKIWLIPNTVENGHKLMQSLYDTGLFNIPE